VTGTTGEARAIVTLRARRLGVPLTIAEPANVAGLDRDGLIVDLPRLGRTRVGLRGRHQAANAAVADALLDALEAAGIATIADDARRRGYADARWPGRLELLDVDGRDVLLDGAHNPAGAASLAAALDDLRPFLRGGRPTLVTASMADKDVAGVVRALTASKALRDARVIATQVGLSRALPADELAQIWRSNDNVDPDHELPRAGAGPLAARAVSRAVAVERDPGAAIDLALAGPRGPIIVAGSLYLVGAVRARLIDDPLLRDPVDNRP